MSDLRAQRQSAEDLLTVADLMKRVDRDLDVLWSGLPAHVQAIVEPMFHLVDVARLKQAADAFYLETEEQMEQAA